MSAPRKQWSDLTPPAQKAIIVLGVAEAVVTAIALVDLVKRPSEAVRGPKAAWALALVVQPLGPISYLAFGRRRAS